MEEMKVEGEGIQLMGSCTNQNDETSSTALSGRGLQGRGR
jgi:hypothetical protein